jgi:ribosomal protein L11 methyltransferase
VVENLLMELNQILHFAWTDEVIGEKNWNEEWEKNYEPVLIAGRCHIRAPFHEKMEGIDYEIEIEPKMSFGTAHHETTQMMIELMLEKNFENLKVLDMGCGTGVLAILASKMGATEVLAIDNDEWAYKNAVENVQKNNLSNITILQGDDQLLVKEQFDIIIANINRNILLQQFDAYINCLQPGGFIFLSGFYEADVTPLLQRAQSGNLNLIEKIRKNSWVAMIVG